MPVTKVHDDESLEKAIRRFKRQCERSGVLREVRNRRHHEKPSVKKKRKAAAARKRVRKAKARAPNTMRVAVVNSNGMAQAPGVSQPGSAGARLRYLVRARGRTSIDSTVSRHFA